MDMMQLRRMVIAQMGMGKPFVKGTFTCPNSDTTQVINFGKTFGSYLFLIEMTDESKTALVASGRSETISTSFIGIYPKRITNNVTASANVLRISYIASTNSMTSGSTGSSFTCGSDSITGNVRDFTATSPYLYFMRGYSYKYTVISLD